MAYIFHPSNYALKALQCGNDLFFTNKKSTAGVQRVKQETQNSLILILLNQSSRTFPNG